MPGEVNCIITKVLIPFVERNVGPDAVAAILRAAGHSRDWLMADHNWIPLSLANELMRLGQQLVGEPDVERFVRRFSEFAMDWKPREERSYIGTWTMGIGDPRTLYLKMDIHHRQIHRWNRFEILEVGRNRGRFRMIPLAGYQAPRWFCVWTTVVYERIPTNWGLPRARVVERTCAARGDDACLIELSWQNPSLGRRFWIPTATGVAAAGALGLVTLEAGAVSPVSAAGAAFGLVAGGVGLGLGLRERQRRQHTQRLLDLQGEEVIYSNNELEKKFQDLDTRIEQLSLLIDLSAAVNATLDPETIYDQALQRLVTRMGYEGARLLLVDHERGVIRRHRRALAARETAAPSLTRIEQGEFEAVELPLDATASVVSKVAVTGRAVLVDDTESTVEPIHRPTAEALGIRSLVAVPLRVRDRVFGVLTIDSTAPSWFLETDADLLSAVANHVALAVDKAESFRTIEELSRGLEDKVRVRTEQLRQANEELGTAYRDLQRTQMQLVQREKMASVGQLVAGVAHELNNPIGFVFSNVTTLEDFVRRLRTMLEAYRSEELPAGAQDRVQARWDELKVDYALRYLDSMTQGIREGAERARKIVRDLRVFARGQDDVWQPVDLHEELESSLTLLNHLLKDRVTVVRKFGDLPSVECVRSQIDQVFLNLLANAAQAIPGEGTITIETRVENGSAVVQITDSGSGIAPEILDKVFDPFFTTKPVGEGTGLGLSISYELIKKHRGQITAVSAPGEGASFTARLPLGRAAAS
jgi:signal transduction histidine kinase